MQKIEILDNRGIVHNCYLDDLKNKSNSPYGIKLISLRFENGVNRIIIHKLTDRLLMALDLLISYL